MKRKSVIAMLLVAVLCMGMLAGCGGEKTETAEDVAVKMEGKVFEKTNEPIPVNNADEFKEWVAGLINIENYKEGSVKKDTFSSYTHTDDMNHKSEKVDGTIYFSDQSKIVLPVAKEELEKSGWTSKGKNLYSNEKGQTISAYSIIAGNEEKGIFETLKIDTRYTGGAPEFCFSEDVTNASSVQDVLEILGEPRGISYDGSDSEIGEPRILLEYAGKDRQLLIFFSVKENKIVLVNFF